MKESCAEAEAIIAELSVVPTRDEYMKALVKLGLLVDAGDRETRNAFPRLVDALGARADASTGMPAIEASRALLDTLDWLQKRCEAAGSSAFS